MPPAAPHMDPYSLFLLEGLIPDPAPVLVVVSEAAASVALRLHEAPDLWPGWPKSRAIGPLRGLDGHSADGLSDQDAAALCEELVATSAWLFLENADALLDSRGGKSLLESVLRGIGSGDLSAVIAAVSPEGLRRLQSGAFRMLGYATILEKGQAANEFVQYRFTSIVREATDRSDTGWVVAVRYALAEPLSPRPLLADDDGYSDAMQLIDMMQLIDQEGEPPSGVLVGLDGAAFTVSQESAAYQTAASAARRLVGRPLRSEEGVTAARAIYYA